MGKFRGPRSVCPRWGISRHDVSRITPLGTESAMRTQSPASRLLHSCSLTHLINERPALTHLIERCAALPSIKKVDHVTFITTPEQKESFIGRWEARGFRRLGTWYTNKYAASHTALVNDSGCEDYPWAEMVGLSVKTGSNAPLDRTVDPVGVEKTQHIAFNVDARADASALYLQQEQLGLAMMTPVRSYTSHEGAGLKQWFTRPVDGFFIEFAQRLPDAHGRPFGGFHPETIEDLYAALDREQIVGDSGQP